MLWHGIVGLCCPLGIHTMLPLGQNKMIMMHIFPLLLSTTTVLHVRNTPMIPMSSTHITRLFNLITSLKMRPWRKFSLLSSYNINWIYSCHYIKIIHLMQFWCSARQRRMKEKIPPMDNQHTFSHYTNRHSFQAVSIIASVDVRLKYAR